MAEIIIGTAGHIDHGKSSLIKAINGFDGDSRMDEKERGITLDTSFSHLGKKLAFVDVPGHEGLLKHMISAAFSFKYCLFLVDINEGLKAQSLEHLRVLEFLGNTNIILILSKCDLCENVDEKAKFILDELADFKLKIIKVFKTSIKDEASLKKLKDYLLTLKNTSEVKGKFRLFIDRSFSLKGVGSVVSGALNSGVLEAGEKVHLCDLDKDYLVKNIQVHGKDVLKVSSPSRVALSLKADLKDLKRGFMLTKKGLFKGFLSLDAVVNAGVKNGTYECILGLRKENVRLKVLQSYEDKSFVSMDFTRPIFAGFKDKFILLLNKRLFSGGSVLNPVSEPLKRPLKLRLLNCLYEDDLKSAFALLVKIHKLGFGLLSCYQRFGLEIEEAREIAGGLAGVFVDEFCVYDESIFAVIKAELSRILTKNNFALLSPSLLASRLSFTSQKLCLEVLQNASELSFENGHYFKAGLKLDVCERKANDSLMKAIKDAHIRPQAPFNIYEELMLSKEDGEKILKLLVKRGLVIRLSHNLYVEKEALDFVLKSMKEYLQNEDLDVQSMKERFKISRKYAISYLEYADKIGLCVNNNGKRTLLKTH